MKAGQWVLLDEINLAGQSVLEGLNALLDHRREVFLPDLGITVRCPASFRLFAAQNPLQAILSTPSPFLCLPEARPTADSFHIGCAFKLANKYPPEA